MLALKSSREEMNSSLLMPVSFSPALTGVVTAPSHHNGPDTGLSPAVYLTLPLLHATQMSPSPEVSNVTVAQDADASNPDAEFKGQLVQGVLPAESLYVFSAQGTQTFPFFHPFQVPGTAEALLHTACCN